jgi:uncharacterized protein (DUF433 family)
MGLVLDSNFGQLGVNAEEGGAKSVAGPPQEDWTGIRTFQAFASSLGQELGPRSLLERVLADHVVLAAWNLQTITDKEYASIPSAPSCGPGERLPGDGCGTALPQGIYLTLQCLEKALYLFRCLASDDLVPAEGPAPAGAKADTATVAPAARSSEADSSRDFDADFDDPAAEANYSNEWPEIGQDHDAEWIAADAGAADQAALASKPAGGTDRKLAGRWHDRLVFDRNVSEHSPVIRGTWITVGQVVSLIVDGWSWSDILRSHPELTDEDLRICLAYTVAEESGDL